MIYWSPITVRNELGVTGVETLPVPITIVASRNPYFLPHETRNGCPHVVTVVLEAEKDGEETVFHVGPPVVLPGVRGGPDVARNVYTHRNPGRSEDRTPLSRLDRDYDRDGGGTTH